MTRKRASSRPARDSFRAVDDTPPPPRKRLAVVLNPTKLDSTGDDVHEVITRVCAEQGWDEPLFIETEEHDVGFGQTRQALAENVDVVCAFGGDGTVRAVAQEMVDSGVPMGLLPGGTGNLLARNLEMPTDDLAKSVEVAITGRNRHIDVGWLRLNPDEAHLEEHVGEGSSVGPRRHAFLVMAGLGLDAAIMEETSEELKAKIGWTAYVPAGMKHLLVERFKAHLSVDGGPPSTIRARTVLIGNCGKLTGGINLMPDAEPDDGTLDVVVIAPKGLMAWVAGGGQGAHQERAHHPDPGPLPVPVGRHPGRPRAEDRARRRHHRRGDPRRGRGAAPRAHRAHRDRPRTRRLTAAGCRVPGIRGVRTCARATAARTAAARCTAR